MTTLALVPETGMARIHVLTDRFEPDVDECRVPGCIHLIEGGRPHGKHKAPMPMWRMSLGKWRLGRAA